MWEGKVVWLESNEIDTGGKREQSLKKKNQFTTCDENTLLAMYMLYITFRTERLLI